ncbi:MAG: hypothetical protein IKK70_03595 [Clostridia bacterium]|nr:hypothetical protein [Clostridia bacterium]
MYNRISEKIKLLAKAIFLIEAVGAIITGIVIGSEEDWLYGILIIFLGPIVAWVSSWLIYGFGELIEQATVCASKQISCGTDTSNTASRFGKNDKFNQERREKIESLYKEGLITETEYEDAISRL